MNMQITEDYCDFETAKLLKEKGYKGSLEILGEETIKLALCTDY